MNPLGVGVVAAGGYVPGVAIENSDLPSSLQANDEWIKIRTGILTRHYAPQGVSTGDLAREAALRALSRLDSSIEIDHVIVATSTPDYKVPGTAPWVASELGLDNVPAFDISAVCSGFLYALINANCLVKSGASKTCLVIGAEKFSSVLDPADRTTSTLFGDGAGAVVVSQVDTDTPGFILNFDYHSNGSERDLIIVPRGGARHQEHPTISCSENTDLSPYFTMDGKRVFRVAVQRMAKSVADVIVKTGWNGSQVNSLIAHQANQRILKKVCEISGVPESATHIHLDRVGNTSSASIPLAICDAQAAGRYSPGDKTILTAFGGGSTWGAISMYWPDSDSINTDIYS